MAARGLGGGRVADVSRFLAGKVAKLSPAVFGTLVRVAEIRNEKLRIVHGSVPHPGGADLGLHRALRGWMGRKRVSRFVPFGRIDELDEGIPETLVARFEARRQSRTMASPFG